MQFIPSVAARALRVVIPFVEKQIASTLAGRDKVAAIARIYRDFSTTAKTGTVFIYITVSYEQGKEKPIHTLLEWIEPP